MVGSWDRQETKPVCYEDAVSRECDRLRLPKGPECRSHHSWVYLSYESTDFLKEINVLKSGGGGTRGGK